MLATRPTGSRLDRLMCGLADEWSADLLSALPGWRVTRGPDGVWLAVTPGGVLAITATFRDRGRRRALVKRHERELAAAQAAVPAPPDGTPVTPVLLVWGPGRPHLPLGYRVDDGVYVVDGERPGTWQQVLSA